MNKKRLENLADGIFSIVLTLVAIDIKPAAFGEVASKIRFSNLWESRSIFLSYTLSFAVLYMYWRSHHFLISLVKADFIQGTLTNLNGLYFMVISLIPFSSRFLAEAPNSETALITFGSHIILIGCTLLMICSYIYKNQLINTYEPSELRQGLIKISIQPIFAILGITAVIWSPSVTWIFYTLPIIFNLIPGSVKKVESLIFGIEKVMI